MVLYFTSTAVDPPATIYMGKDKFENEELLKYGLENDVWFHVDKLSSAHVYLRLPPQIESWEAIPEALVNECSQLVKANSIEGNKKSNLTIIYTPWANVKKTGDMAVGAVTFFNDRKVKRFHIKEKDNVIVNRLNKTKKEVQVDHEAERQDRLRQEGRVKKAKAIEDKKAQQAEQKKRKEEAEARDYSKLYSAEAMEEERRRKEERKLAKLNGTASDDDQDEEHDDGMDSDDSFM
ncbi:related to JLP2 DnaJ-Like Protein 2 [Ustilago trichophora]|uniref:Related to JLP2 DnaJ-Like Protein 2 n=1 Tax=Ustilago trichophora TaxID=86804 RepID=A0A5C3DPF8_9BASI|nr:related to JLP2 DnaJ-Like Protein 2 [Ustilago trichophora]